MNVYSFITLLPAIVLCIYVYMKDRVEKEPWWLLLILFVSGAALCIPVQFLQELLTGLFDSAFSSQMKISLVSGAVTYSSDGAMFFHLSLCAFIGIALVEELIKWAVIFLITRKNKNFDCLFDGIVYHVFFAFGFAIVDNLHYAAKAGIDTLLLRSFAYVPSYLLFGVVSGFLYTLWHTYYTACKKENELFKDGKIEKKRIRTTPVYLAASLIIPTFVRGIYAYTLLDDSINVRFFYYVTIVLLYAFCFITVYRVSKRDERKVVIADNMIKKLHPEIPSEKPAQTE